MTWKFVPITVVMNKPGTTPVDPPPVVVDPSPVTVYPGGTVRMVGSNVLADLDPDPLRKMVEAGFMGQAGLVSNGGHAFAPNYGTKGAVVIGGGGHGDYGGNEVYAFDLALEKWVRLSDPTGIDGDPLAPTSVTDPRIDWDHGELPDGAPMGWHGFNTMFVAPGGTNNQGLLCSISRTSLGIGGGGPSAPWVHAADLGVTPIAKPTKIWSRYSLNSCTIGVSSIPTPSINCYDVGAGVVWGGYAGGFHTLLTKFDLATRLYTMVPGVKSSYWGYMPCATAHPVRGLMLWVAGYGNYNAQKQFAMYALDLAHPENGVFSPKLAGDIPPIANVSAATNGGLPAVWAIDWDTHNDCGYICCSDDDRDHVYRVDAPTDPINGTWQLTRVALSSPLPALAPALPPKPKTDTNLDAVYGHWRYCASVKAFSYITTTKQKLALWYP